MGNRWKVPSEEQLCMLSLFSLCGYYYSFVSSNAIVISFKSNHPRIIYITSTTTIEIKPTKNRNIG
jgi:hypothetical protein